MKYKIKKPENYLRIYANAITIEQIEEKYLILNNTHTRPDLFCEKYLHNKIPLETQNTAEQKEVHLFSYTIFKKLNFNICLNSKEEQGILQTNCKFADDILQYITNLRQYEKSILNIVTNDNGVYMSGQSNIFFNAFYTLIYLFVDNKMNFRIYLTNKPTKKRIIIDEKKYKKYFSTNFKMQDLFFFNYTLENNVVITPIHRQDIVSVSFILADLINLNLHNIKYTKTNKQIQNTQIETYYTFLQNKGFKYVKPCLFIDERTLYNLDMTNHEINESKFIKNPVSSKRACFTQNMLGFLLNYGFKKQHLKTPIKIVTENAKNEYQGIIITKNENCNQLINSILPIDYTIEETDDKLAYQSYICTTKKLKFKIKFLKQKYIQAFKYRPETTIIYLHETE